MSTCIEQEVSFMETPLQIELDGVKSSAYLKELIESNLAKIEKRFGRATACRVVVRAPNAHHQSGEPFEVSIRIALPARKEINVNHTPSQDERLADLTAAVNAAFKRALRQLDDEAQLMRGRVKTHAA
jgi:ribosome-associated translation inhibitor RaiA